MVQKQPNVLKNWLLLLLCMAIMPAVSSGQTVTIGATSGTSHFVYGPYYRSSAASSFNYSRYAYLYTAAELGIPAGATITKVEWLKASGTITGSNTFNVWMKNVSSSSLADNTSWNTLTTSATAVYASSTHSFAGGNDSWEAVNLGTTFSYTGGNIQIMTDFEKGSSATASGPNNFYVNSAAGKALGWATNNPISGTTGLTAASYGDSRPTIRVTYTPGAACAGTPTAGTAVSSATGFVCAGSSVDLNLTGNTAGSGITYQWESSASASGPWSTVGSSSASSAITVNPMSSTYYHVVVTCGANSATSAAVQVSVSTPFAGGTYTVNSAMPTGGSNFHSFTDLAAALNCAIGGPVTVNVAAGTYSEQFELGEIGGTSSTNTITINGGGATITNVSISNDDRAVITLNGTDYVTINNLNITASSTSSSSYGWGVHMTNGADNNNVSNCNITLSATNMSTNYAGIVISGSSMSAVAPGSNSDGNMIIGNTVIGGFYGVAVGGSDNTVKNNVIRDFAAYGVYAGAGINTNIEGNNIHRSTRNTNISDFYGIWVFGNNSGLTIKTNTIHDPATLAPTTSFSFTGIGLSNCYATTGNVVVNNTVYNVQGNGTQNLLYNNASNANWYHNSVNSDYPAATGGTTRGFFQENAPSGVANMYIMNNVFAISRGGTGTHYAVDIQAPAAGVVTGNNDYYATNVGRKGSNTYASLAAWQSANSDANSVAVDPIFTNASAGNLTPGNTALNNTGTNVSIATDITGATRNNPPDMGAYEFSVVTCGGTPAAGTISAPSSACSGVSFGLSVTGFATGLGISYQWESALVASNTWMPISGATNTYYIATQTAAMKYRLVTTCSNSGFSATSSSASVSMSAGSNCYCISYATGSNDGDITGVSFGSLNHSSDCNTTGSGGSMQSRYADYTSLDAASVTKGNTVPFTLTFGTCNTALSSYAKIFIDYNADGDFDDAGETAYTSGAFVASAGTEVSGTVTIPSGATAGTTRMRVVMVEGSSASAVTSCGAYGFGETEDYAITINANTGTQPAMTLTSVTSNTIKFSLTRANLNTATMVVISEGPLTHDPVNFTDYAAMVHGKYTGNVKDTNLDAMANGLAIFTFNSGAATPAASATKSFTIQKLKSGVHYYIYAYAYAAQAGGKVYNTAGAVIDGTTDLVAPTTKAKALKVLSTTANTATVRFIGGGGAGRIVTMMEKPTTGNAPTNDPTNNTAYTGNNAFGLGDPVAAGDYVVSAINEYQEGDTVVVTYTNLKAGAKYRVNVYEYNGGQNPGEDILYGAAFTNAGVIATTADDFVKMAKSAVGVANAQNFDTMGATLPFGWHASGSLSTDNGSSSTEGIKNYGTTSNSDRALGSLGSGMFGVKVKNNTTGTSAVTWSSILIKYSGEQWRNGDASSDNLKLQWSTNAYTFNDANQYLSSTPATWTDASTNLTFTSPNSSSTGAINGNSNTTTRMASIVTDVLAGDYIWFRWVDATGTTPDGLAIDNVEIVPFIETVTAGAITDGAHGNGLNVVGTATASNINVKKIFNIEEGSTLDMSVTGAKITIAGPLYGTGQISTTNAQITISPVANIGQNQTMYFTPSANTVSKLILGKNATATLGNTMNVDPAGAVKVGGTAASDYATLTTNGNLVLKGSTTDAAYIDKMPGGYVVGDVTVEAVLNNASGVRLLSHPFSAAQTLSAIHDDLPLDVSGGANHNVWYYNAATSQTSQNTTAALTSSAVWTGFTSLSDNWNTYQAIRVFKPVGTATLDMTGAVTQGAVNFTTTSGPSGFVTVGNPYPSQTKINTVPGNVSAVYYWNPLTSNWVTKTGSSMKITVPMCGAFVAKGPVNTAINWSFSENDKVNANNIHATFLRSEGEVAPEGMLLNVNKGGKYVDEMAVYFNEDAKTSNEEYSDAMKMENPGLDFYTKSSEGIKLAVDTRRYDVGTKIPVGLAKTETGKYTFSVAEFNMNSGNEVYLMDVYTGKRTTITANTVYTFNVDENPMSTGEGRFYLQLGKSAKTETAMVLELAPNPAADVVNVKVSGTQDGKADVKVLSMTGAVMISTQMESVANGQLTIPVNNLATGVYMVEVSVNGQKVTKQLVKQ